MYLGHAVNKHLLRPTKKKERQEFPAGDSKSVDFDKEMKNIDRIPENRISLRDWRYTLEVAWVKIPYDQLRLICRLQYIVMLALISFCDLSVRYTKIPFCYLSIFFRFIIREVAKYFKKGI